MQSSAEAQFPSNDVEWAPFLSKKTTLNTKYSSCIMQTDEQFIAFKSHFRRFWRILPHFLLDLFRRKSSAMQFLRVSYRSVKKMPYWFNELHAGYTLVHCTYRSELIIAVLIHRAAIFLITSRIAMLWKCIRFICKHRPSLLLYITTTLLRSRGPIWKHRPKIG